MAKEEIVIIAKKESNGSILTSLEMSGFSPNELREVIFNIVASFTNDFNKED